VTREISQKAQYERGNPAKKDREGLAMRLWVLGLVVLGAGVAWADATILLPNGQVIERFDWDNGDSTYMGPNGNAEQFRWDNGDSTTILPEGGTIEEFNWGGGKDDE
jgi:hypothetical protein